MITVRFVIGSAGHEAALKVQKMPVDKIFNPRDHRIPSASLRSLVDAGVLRCHRISLRVAEYQILQPFELEEVERLGKKKVAPHPKASTPEGVLLLQSILVGSLKVHSSSV